MSGETRVVNALALGLCDAYEDDEGFPCGAEEPPCVGHVQEASEVLSGLYQHAIWWAGAEVGAKRSTPGESDEYKRGFKEAINWAFDSVQGLRSPDSEALALRGFAVPAAPAVVERDEAGGQR